MTGHGLRAPCPHRGHRTAGAGADVAIFVICFARCSFIASTVRKLLRGGQRPFRQSVFRAEQFIEFLVEDINFSV